jgi:glycosyltransferase involved in cell wall biosynthesis
MHELDLTILMPCLNEAETLAFCVRQAKQAIHESGVRGEVLVADNGSTDGSQAIAESEGARVVHVPIRGYGAALTAGIDAARGKYIMMADADASYHFEHLPRFLPKLDEGYDLVMGNRFAGRIEQGAMPRLHKYLGNPVLSAVGRIFFSIPVRHFHCGLRAFRRGPILALNLRTTGMEFASEMVVKSSLANLRITRCRRPSRRMGARGRRTCALGATAGAICGSCCSIAHAGYFSIQGLPYCCWG